MQHKEDDRKMPWEAFPHIWPTKAKFLTYLRGCLRKAWNTNPIKNQYKNSRKKQIVNPNPNGRKPTVQGFECELCNQDHPMKEAQVDHIIGENSLREIEDIQQFTENLLLVTEDDLMLVCKSCHSIKSHMERYGFSSYEEAKLDKEAIAFNKLPIAEQKSFLGVPQSEKITKKQLRQLFVDKTRQNMLHSTR